jgi:hypothetical protein
MVSQFQQSQGGQPAYQSGVDQAQTWRTAANAAAADPCQVIAAIARDSLKEGVDTLVRLGLAERRAWAIRNQAQRARLCSLVEQQVKQEFRFIEDVARSEAIARTASDANSMQLLWGRRLQFVTDRIREVRRQEMAQAAGRPAAAARPAPALRPGSPAAQTQTPAPQPLGLAQDANVVTDYFAPSTTRADQEQLATAWASAGTDTNADQILTDFNDLLIKDLGYLRTSAVTAKATPKVLAAVDAVILIRSQRHALVRSDLQALAGASTGAQGAVGQGQVPGQQTGRRGAAVQSGQGAGTGYNRGTRRGRMQQGN